MAIATDEPLPLAGDLIDVITNGSFWSLDGSRTIRWAISDGFHGEEWNVPEAVYTNVNEALRLVSYYANVQFEYVGYYVNPAVSYDAGADLNISLSGHPSIFSNDNVWARGGFPLTEWEAYDGQSGDLFLNINSDANSLPSYAPGSAGWFLLLHELGHTLGLKHLHDDGGTGRPTFQNLGLEGLDSDWVSVMSYNDDYDFDLISFDPATYMALDVLGLQALYGPNRTTNAGDSTYPLRKTAFYYTIWDAGGRDTLDASQATEGWQIYLPFLQGSSIVPERIGYASPYAERLLSSPGTLTWIEGDIENAVGSAYADEINGNALANVLRGNGGADSLAGGLANDTLYGGSGKDIFLFDTTLHRTRNVDQVKDYRVRDDSIWLDNDVFKRLADGKMKKDAYWTGSKAHDRSDRIIYNKDTGVLLYDADGTGKAAAIKFAQLSKGLSMGYGEFFVI
ncbi:MAG TPA: hypothetical protein VIL09_05505 [Microvirga sp.]|jgi:serralysin